MNFKKIIKPILKKISSKVIAWQLDYPHINNIEIAVKDAKKWQFDNNIKFYKEVSLDIGCGNNPRNPFKANKLIGVDIAEDVLNNEKYHKRIKADISDGKLPFENNSIEYITAFDFIEHLSRENFKNETLNPFIQCMNEIHRILKNGGVFLSHTPAYPFKVAFSDPTHQNLITENTFPLYFCKNVNGESPWARMYGYKGDLELIKQYWLHDHLVTVMGKSK